MRACIGVLIFSGVFVLQAGAQDIRLNAEPAIDLLFNTWISSNRRDPHLEGWRLQILSTPDRLRVEEGKTFFLSNYPDIPADWVQEKPYYKLRVGAFRTRLEAMSFLNAELKDSYPGAYPAKDPNIHPRDFLKQ